MTDTADRVAMRLAEGLYYRGYLLLGTPHLVATDLSSHGLRELIRSADTVCKADDEVPIGPESELGKGIADLRDSIITLLGEKPKDSS